MPSNVTRRCQRQPPSFVADEKISELSPKNTNAQNGTKTSLFQTPFHFRGNRKTGWCECVVCVRSVQTTKYQKDYNKYYTRKIRLFNQSYVEAESSRAASGRTSAYDMRVDSAWITQNDFVFFFASDYFDIIVDDMLYSLLYILQAYVFVCYPFVLSTKPCGDRHEVPSHMTYPFVVFMKMNRFLW